LILALVSGKISFSFLKDVLPLFNRSAQTLIAKLLPEVIQIVTELAKNRQLTDKQKQKEAFTKIQKLAKKEGLEVGTSLINLIIEMAVTSIKE
jgi:predicted rRNA methylase YqxC with S4 and FtsJ domains